MKKHQDFTLENKAYKKKMDKREPSSRKPFWKKVSFYIFLILPLCCLVFLQICRADADYAEIYARRVFPVLTYLPRMLNTFLPFSLSEFCVVLGVPLILLFLIYAIVRLIVKGGRREFLRKTGRVLFILASLGICLFYLNFGFCYQRHSLNENLGLQTQKRSKEDLYTVSKWAAEHIKELAPQVGRNEEGLFTPRISRDQIMRTAAAAYKNRADSSDKDFVRQHLYLGPVRCKPVMLSHYWSYTGITGVYVPFLTESNVNVAVRPDEMIFTVLHETAHSYGFAREDEANFLAFYTGIAHDDPEIRYGCWLLIYTHLNNALYSADKNLHAEVYGLLPPEARADLSARNAFWKQFEGPVREVSEQVNNAYLKANKVEDGVKSYGRVVDLVLAYYQGEIGGLAQ